MSAPQSYARDKGRCSTSPIFVPGELYQFYVNFDEPTNDPNFDFFRLDLYTALGALVGTAVGTLHKDVVRYDFYNIYISLQFPAVANGYYYFVVQDTSAATEKMRSNLILVEGQQYAENTAVVAYRNRFDRDNIQYEKNPTYYTKLRLPLIETDYQFEGENKQYRNVSNGRLRTFHKYEDEVSRIESYYFDKEMHRAAAAMYRHDEIYINNVFAVTKGTYQRENFLFSVHTKAHIDVILDQEAEVPIHARAAQWFLINNLLDEITTVANDFIIVDH